MFKKCLKSAIAIGLSFLMIVPVNSFAVDYVICQECASIVVEVTDNQDDATHSVHCLQCGYENHQVPHYWIKVDNHDGTHTKTCDECGATLTQAHVYSNGHCIDCDAVDPASLPSQPSEPDPEPQPEPEQVPIVSVGSQEPQVQDGDQGENANVETPVDKAQKLMESQIILVLSRNKKQINALKKYGVTLDLGTWESLNKESFEKIDILLGNGIPVTIRYRYNNQVMEMTIPTDLKYKLAGLCDANGFLGLENLRGKLIADGYIKVETNDDEEMNIEIIDGIPMPVPKDPPKFEMKKLDIDGQVPSFDRIIGSQNNSNALPGTASLSAAGTTAATSPATSISKDTGSVSAPNFAIAPANTEEWDDSIDSEIFGDIQNAIKNNTDYKIYVASDGKFLTLTIKADSLKNWEFRSYMLRNEVDKMVSEKKSITI